MGAFADTLFSVLLSWVKSAVGSLVTLFESGGDRGLLAWLGNNWLFVVLVLIAGGLVADWLVWLVRWQPYHIWATRVRHVKRSFCRLLRLGGRRDEEDEEEEDGQTGTYQMLRDEMPTRIVPVLRQEPLELPEEERRAAFEQAQAVPEEALGAYPGQRYDAVSQIPLQEQAQYAYDEQPAYVEQTVYDEQPAYVEQTVYEQQPAYVEQTVYEEQPAYDERPRSIYERPVEPEATHRDADAETSQELVPGVDPFAPYDAPEVLKALGDKANNEPEQEMSTGRRRRRRRTGTPEQPTGMQDDMHTDPEETEDAPGVAVASPKEPEAAAPLPDDDLPEPPQWPDWSNTAVTPVVRMEDVRIPGSRVKPSMIDRLRERVEQRQSSGGEKKRSRIANFFDPREEPVKGLAPRVKKEDAFSKPVQPEKDGTGTQL